MEAQSIAIKKHDDGLRGKLPRAALLPQVWERRSDQFREAVKARLAGVLWGSNANRLRTGKGEQVESIVTDAIRTEPTYGLAIQRLQDPRTVRLLHVAMGLATEAGEFVDALKKHIFYGKPIDETNLIEELGDSTWYERIGCATLEVEYFEMIRRNVAKLKARYPEKFTEAAALVRDLPAERKVLDNV